METMMMMAGLIGLQLVTLSLTGMFLKPGDEVRWLAPKTNPAKRATEIWFLCYACVWISAFAYIVASGSYENFTAATYFIVCGGLALPLYVQPFFVERGTPLAQRVSLRLNVWLGIFGFAGNYWYTHYFYSVLRAKYTMPAWRVNDVPLCMFFATHFYFSFYHALSNCLLRRVDSYVPGLSRKIFKLHVILTLSYVTAFMEAWTIEKFPYYSFEDRDQAYVVGSAFYGIYFLVSFPWFYAIDEYTRRVVRPADRLPLTLVVKDALAASFVVLCLLDFVRLFLHIPFVMA